ncbi:MAG TPA: outer membrane beta-barrel protein [Bacteroidales bacterium]|nr:outer membrane beta-barrel protein [Bacteroidales bacterium]
MKKKVIVILSAVIIITGFCKASPVNGQDKKETTATAKEKTSVTIGNDKVRFEEGDSSYDLKVGNRGIRLLESLEGPRVRFKKYSGTEEEYTDHHDWSYDEEDNYRSRRARRFRGHWSGVEFGFNNYMMSDNSFSVPTDIAYMSLNSGKSACFNINFTQLSIGFARHIGLVTGLGLNWNNYRFDGNNNIQKDPNGVIEELVPGGALKKSKLATLYLDLPVLLEIQLPTDHHRLNIAAGPIGAVKIASHSKMVFEDGPKVKSYKDFSLNMLRYGATARVGYGNVEIFGTYYATPLFQDGKAPGGYDMYPFEIGVAFTFND